MDPKMKAKMNALKSLKDVMSQLIGSDIKGGMSKVTVAAGDKEGLKEGLEKAKELVSKDDVCEECGGKHEEGAEHESEELEASEGESEESLEDLQKQLEDLKAKIQAKTMK